uniref:SAM domain-containing protein n=1 Tax=Stomoxys calcitrans TaxID=35570 RepID=A0A1I8PXX6_STOCA
MNPLNAPQQSQTQYFITTGMPPLVPTSDQHLTTTASTLTQQSLQLPTVATNNPSINNQQANHFVDANKFVTTNYVPVLITNQTLLTNIEPIQQHHQQQQQQSQNISPSIISVTNSPVVASAATANIPLMPTNPGGNVTYVMTSPQTPNFAPVLPGQNGTVSVLLTTPTTTTMATSGHVAAPFLIRSTSTQVKQQHPQHQLQQSIHNQTFNTQQMNAELLKQVNTGTTLLKTSLLQNKSAPKMPSNINSGGGGAIAQALVTQAVQKLPQVSLLQNSKNKQTVTVVGGSSSHSFVSGASIIAGKSSSTTSKSEKIKETSDAAKSSYEIRVGDLNAEVSLIKKATLNTDTPSASTSKVETNSLLKPSVDLKRKRDKSLAGVVQNSKPGDVVVNEKSHSLLKAKNNVAECNTNPVSPRSQRSKSWNSILKSQTQALVSNTNERRHSEPAKMEKPLTDTAAEGQKSAKELGQMENSNNIILEEFEDEEYLESSGEKTNGALKQTSEEPTLSQESNNEKECGNKEINQMEEETTKKSTITNDMPNNINANSDEIEENNKEQTKKLESDSDDDVTILPMDNSLVEPIEIDDDDEECVGPQKVPNDETSPSTKDKQKCNDSLLCEEQILVSSSSSISNQSLDQISLTSSVPRKSPKIEPDKAATSTAPILKRSLTDRKQTFMKEEPPSNNGYSSVLDMLSNFDMLNWKERLGTGRGTNMKFQLNEFNLVQLHEKIPGRTKSYTAYEKPIYERDDLQIRSQTVEPQIYYMCRRCKVRALALDFLAPEFCSMYCLKRDCRKRQREDQASIIRKKHRYLVSNNNPPPLAYITQPKFRWSNYLKANYTSMAAPISLFLNPFPTGPNYFKIGMKLEAIDPENCALFCVCTVVDINGYRLKLSFDGYDSSYDFWINADSMDIFPPGWCAKTNRILQPPKGINASKFNWAWYFNKEKGLSAPRQLFTHLNSSSLSPRNPFQIGMHLEAEDLNDTGKLCVASVADVLDDRIRIHFDGWDDCYDIIVDINSPYIHPCGWHEGRHQLVVPPDCENSAFSWKNYIKSQGKGIIASEELFMPREPIHFKPNMKLEVVDPRNSSLIRPATVVSHKGHRVKLHLDGWPNDYCFWLEDDSPDLHPIGWCDATGHDLEPPPGFQMGKQKMPCPTPGCRGIGNAKKSFMAVHANRDCCPYVPENWRLVVEKPPRVGYDDIVRTLPRLYKINNVPHNSQRLSDHQVSERLQILDNIKTRNVLMHQDKTDTFKESISMSMGTVKREESKETKHNKLEIKRIDEEPSLDVNIDIVKEFLCDYGPRLQQAYTLWQKNFTLDTAKIKRNPLLWSVSEVGVFVDLYLNCPPTAALFAQEDIDGEAFLLLQQCDLTERLNVKLGHAVKLYSCILQLRTLAVTKFNVAYRKVPPK